MRIKKILKSHSSLVEKFFRWDLLSSGFAGLGSVRIMSGFLYLSREILFGVKLESRFEFILGEIIGLGYYLGV